MGRSFEEHLQNVRRVLQKLKEANLKLSPSKCHLFRREVTYLGHIISAEGVRTDPDKISAVRHWTCPTDVHQLRNFLGLCTYYQKFVKNFSTIARPLHKLTEAKQKFIWTDECDNAFNKLKDALTSAPVLAYPAIGKQFILDTVSSHECIGAVLSQEIDGQERVIAYFSKCLSKQERNYCVTRKELLAIVKAVENFNPYLYGRRFLLRTDHASLTWLLNFKKPEGQIARWIQRLQEYDMEIRHRKGLAHGNADALSRRPCSENCNYCSRVEKKFGMVDPVVHQELHGSPTGGHFGVTKTLQKVRERFYWNNVRNDVEKWCRTCNPCAACKGPGKRIKGRLQLYNVGAPFERIAFDIIGPLPRSSDGNNNILVVMDYFTKWPEAYPIPDQEAPTVAEILVQNWISTYGVPLQLHSDQGRNFDSAVCRRLYEILGIDKTRTTALHPQSDGMVERFNRTILNSLSLLVLLAIPHLKCSSDVTFVCADLLFSRPPDAPLVSEEYVENLRTRMEEVHHLARDRIGMASEKMKTRYDARATGHNFHEGDQVWLWNPKRRKGLSPKLQTNWEGPYTVPKRLNDVVVRIQKSPHSKPKVIHCNRLAPYLGQGD
ncbi:Retrovirus-related Pol polyprotein like [Argiope bruennichi]|uniref:RNA-directed DNA polymerase n=1 Tax=Argiope bruennichi TaxID=94029 RepID=A0A8T0FV67_ARGBR|nr:Retrovirus-related Pol polyprotein like [Argiope bruennichi]